MSVIFLLIPLSILFAGAFLAAFIWAVRSGQYEDTTTPSMRVLLDGGSTATTRRNLPGPNPARQPPSEPASGPMPEPDASALNQVSPSEN